MEIGPFGTCIKCKEPLPINHSGHFQPCGWCEKIRAEQLESVYNEAVKMFAWLDKKPALTMNWTRHLRKAVEAVKESK